MVTYTTLDTSSYSLFIDIGVRLGEASVERNHKSLTVVFTPNVPPLLFSLAGILSEIFLLKFYIFCQLSHR